MNAVDAAQAVNLACHQIIRGPKGRFVQGASAWSAGKFQSDPFAAFPHEVFDLVDNRAIKPMNWATAFWRVTALPVCWSTMTYGRCAVRWTHLGAALRRPRTVSVGGRRVVRLTACP